MRIRLPGWREVAEFLTVAVCTGMFAVTALGIFAALTGPHSAGTRDFVEYWASGQQLAHGGNPYDREPIQRLERQAGFPAGAPTLMMGNPPPALLLVLPLGFLGPVAAEMLWELLLLGCLIASVRMIRQMHGSQQNLLHVLGYSFAPALACLLAGQMALPVLLGLVLFLRWHRRRPWRAGASLWLCLLKPHLFLPFGAVLLAWIAVTRSYRILAGTGVALAVSSAAATALDPRVWTEYASMMHAERIDRAPMPSFSSLLRFHVAPHTLWLQCLPAGLACVWALAWFWRRRGEWDWVRDGSLLMLVSVLAAPYTWFVDQTALIPALLYGAYATRSRAVVAALALMSAAIEFEALRGLELMHSNFFLWTTPAWLIWWLCATASRPPKNLAAVELAAEQA